jgi:hypothetical protein
VQIAQIAGVFARICSFGVGICRLFAGEQGRFNGRENTQKAQNRVPISGVLRGRRSRALEVQSLEGKVQNSKKRRRGSTCRIQMGGSWASFVFAKLDFGPSSLCRLEFWWIRREKARFFVSCADGGRGSRHPSFSEATKWLRRLGPSESISRCCHFDFGDCEFGDCERCGSTTMGDFTQRSEDGGVLTHRVTQLFTCETRSKAPLLLLSVIPGFVGFWLGWRTKSHVLTLVGYGILTSLTVLLVFFALLGEGRPQDFSVQWVLSVIPYWVMPFSLFLLFPFVAAACVGRSIRRRSAKP